MGLTEVNQVLTLNNLRHSVTLRTDGGIKTGRDVVIAAMGGLLPLVFLALVLGSEVLVVVAIVAILRIVLARQIIGRLGGYTGDCMGAIQQITEVSFYLGLLVML